MNILILTSNLPRHNFFALSIIEEFKEDTIIIIQEPKGLKTRNQSRLKTYLGSNKKIPILKKLFLNRLFKNNLKKITDEKFITGTSRRAFSFNGCQDISNIMPRYRRYPGSVVDVLADRAESLQLLPVEKFLNRVIRDLPKVWPEGRNAEVKLAIGAHIHPTVLYHKEVPRLPSERNRLVDTPLQNLFACNCSLGLIGIGMESAYQAGKLAANRILEQEGKPTVHVYGFPQYKINFLSRTMFKFIHILVRTRNLIGKILTSV